MILKYIIIRVEPNFVKNHKEIRESKKNFKELRLEKFGRLVVLKRDLSQYLENILRESFS
ncbi:hypothetical protein D1631_05765 [Chryseobacterium nematophagum]|uniref:Uncharacterized protein n=1 Tax=Chryseobacterium nematophagum TaxID=2305228 RepID=A0A3M7TD16_9FLAO|nr:hypothetical protein D1631_05765 [Chryseobacterium nematophagum]